MENQTSKYFKYAIGEIVLVVIGILIALQINNWNEYRKDRFVEQKILQSINGDLETDIKTMTSMLNSESLLVESNWLLIKILKNNASTYTPKLDTIFGDINRYDLFYPQKLGYEALKSKGLEILQNDSLKAEIVNLYDVQYALAAEMMDLKKQIYLNTNIIFNRHLETITNGKNIGVDNYILRRPNDFDDLKNNAEFINNLTGLTVEQANFLNLNNSILEKMKTTKVKIHQELLYD